MAILIKSYGETCEVKPDGKKFSLRKLQELVGGDIEIVPYGSEMVVCDEEGKLKGRPLNHVATRRYGRFLDPFVGDVLIVKRNEI